MTPLGFIRVTEANLQYFSHVILMEEAEKYQSATSSDAVCGESSKFPPLPAICKKKRTGVSVFKMFNTKKYRRNIKNRVDEAFVSAPKVGRTKIGKRKIPLNILTVPIDDISFQSE